jgi:hypothetical protein
MYTYTYINRFAQGAGGKTYAKGPGGANIFVYNLPPDVGDWDLVQVCI